MSAMPTTAAALPDGWRVVRLGDVAEISFSSVDKKTVDGESPVKLCNYTDVFYNRQIRPDMPFMVATASPTECDRWALKEGDVLFTKDSETADEIGIPAYVSEDMPDVLCGYHLARARPRTAVDGAFLARALGSHATAREFARIANGITRFGLTLDATRSLPIALPPLGEQRAIADVLDAIDEAGERTEAVVAAGEGLRDALLHELLTRGLPGRHTDWRDVPGLGTMPASWEAARLGDVASIRREQVKPETDDVQPYVALEHIASRGTLIGCGRAGESVSNKTLFRKGDTLYGKLRPNLRKVTRAEFDGVCSTEILAIFGDEQVSGSFLSHLLRSDVLHLHAMAGVAGTKMPRTSWSHLSSIRIPLPPLDEQRAIAAALDSVDASIEGARAEAEALRTAKASTADALLTGRVRVGSGVGGRKP